MATFAPNGGSGKEKPWWDGMIHDDNIVTNTTYLNVSEFDLDNNSFEPRTLYIGWSDGKWSYMDIDNKEYITFTYDPNPTIGGDSAWSAWTYKPYIFTAPPSQLTKLAEKKYAFAKIFRLNNERTHPAVIFFVIDFNTKTFTHYIQTIKKISNQEYKLGYLQGARPQESDNTPEILINNSVLWNLGNQYNTNPLPIPMVVKDNNVIAFIPAVRHTSYRWLHTTTSEQVQYSTYYHVDYPFLKPDMVNRMLVIKTNKSFNSFSYGFHSLPSFMMDNTIISQGTYDKTQATEWTMYQDISNFMRNRPSNPNDSKVVLPFVFRDITGFYVEVSSDSVGNLIYNKVYTFTPTSRYDDPNLDIIKRTIALNGARTMNYGIDGFIMYKGNVYKVATSSDGAPRYGTTCCKININDTWPALHTVDTSDYIVMANLDWLNPDFYAKHSNSAANIVPCMKQSKQYTVLDWNEVINLGYNVDNYKFSKNGHGNL